MAMKVHIIFKDGKPHGVEFPDNWIPYFVRERIVKENALPIINPEIIPYTMLEGKPVEWIGTAEKIPDDYLHPDYYVYKLHLPSSDSEQPEQNNFCEHHDHDECDCLRYCKDNKPEPADEPKEPYFKLSHNEYGKPFLHYKPDGDGRYCCWMPISEEFYSEFEILLKCSTVASSPVRSRRVRWS